MVDIRRCQGSDAPGVKQLINGIMLTEFSQDAQAYPAADLDQIEVAYGGIGEAFFIAWENEHIIGTVAIKKEDERVALLRRLFVAPSHRNKKIGVKLLERALQFCREAGYDELVFRTTSRMVRAIELCKRKGFVQRAKIELGPIELFKFVLNLKSSDEG